MKVIATKERQEVQITPSTICDGCMFEDDCISDDEHKKVGKFEKENGIDPCDSNNGVIYILLGSE